MRALPRITERGPTGLILWLRRDQPAIYSQLVATIPEVAQIETVLRQESTGQLGGIGSAIAGFAKTAMSKIAKALPQIATTAVDVASQVYVAKQQTKMVNAQIKQAELNQAPLPTVAVTGEQVSITSPITGQRVVQPAVVLKPTLIPGVPDPVTYVGGGLLALLVLKRMGVL